MDGPFSVEDLFEVNEDLEVVEFDNYVQIDNFYKNADQINEMLLGMPKEMWKCSPGSRNFIDYYDTRPYFNNSYPDEKKTYNRHSVLYDVIRKKYGWDNIKFNKSLTFNVFQHIITGLDKRFQHHPHTDKDGVNTLVYLDKHESGGTALYRKPDWHQDREDVNLIIDISKYDMVEVIPHQFNRMVVFHGNLLHGAYIEDNQVYENEWRITHASLCRRQDRQRGMLIE